MVIDIRYQAHYNFWLHVYSSELQVEAYILLKLLNAGCVSKPTWDHILFTACHNKHIDIERSPGATTSKRRLKDWISSEWEDLIAEYLTKHRNKESL